MKLMKATLRRLWRLTRTTSIVVGLAVMLALVAGVASLAVAQKPPEASAGALLLNAANTVSKLTSVTGTMTDPILRLVNSGTGAALDLQVGEGKAPMTVNEEAGTATYLSADTVDDKDSEDFLGAEQASDFLGVNDKAADSDKLDGKDSADFASASTGKAYSSVGADKGPGLIAEKALPQGNYVITDNVNAFGHNPDIDESSVFMCEIKANNTLLAQSIESPGNFSPFHANINPDFDGYSSLSMTGVYSATGAVNATLNCKETHHESSDAEPILSFSGTLTALRVSSIE